MTLSLEDQVRAYLDATRGLTDVALKLQTAPDEEVNLVEATVSLLTISKALMDCAVDLARAIDQLAEHTGYPGD